MQVNAKLKDDVHFQKENVSFPALDQYRLHGVVYKPTQIESKARIIVASATAVPQPFYRRFAEYATQFGFEVLTFDYRGVAQSAPQQLKGFEMSYLDWGTQDLAGAIEYFHSAQMPLFLTAHSYGGQALGLTPNHHKIKAMYCYGTGAGWAGYMPFKEKFKVSVMWNIVFPPIVALKGYLPWSKLNMGADLPLGVYQQWRRWCKYPTYFFADPEQQSLKPKYAQVETKIVAISALDDDWALPPSRQAFMQHYTAADMTFVDISADQFSMKSIGHMGYFRAGAEKIWDRMLSDYLNLID